MFKKLETCQYCKTEVKYGDVLFEVYQQIVSTFIDNPSWAVITGSPIVSTYKTVKLCGSCMDKRDSVLLDLGEDIKPEKIESEHISL